MTGTVEAVQHVRRMRGGAQSHLMRCADERFYVVKFQNNPQHLRVLANELLATRLAEMAGLPVPVPMVVQVGGWLVERTPELRIQLSGTSQVCKPGAQFGARFVVDPFAGQVMDYLPEGMIERVQNLAEFAGMLCFDKWTGNANGRQAVFWKRGRERKYKATFIDQGYCFNAGEWSFPDSALRGVHSRNEVYAHIRGWDSFEPWLSNIAAMDPGLIRACADEVPFEWYEDTGAMERLVEQLVKRRTCVPELIAAFRESSRQPFPGWVEKASTVQ